MLFGASTLPLLPSFSVSSCEYALLSGFSFQSNPETRQDIAELGRKVDDLCVVVINNHTGVETALRKSPSVALSQPGDNPGNVGPSSAAQSSAASTISASEAEGLDSESISSSEKVAKSYRHYQDAMSVFSTKKSWRKRAVEAFDETASLHGLAPSTIVAYNPSVDNESVAEHHPVFPTVSIDVRMQNWLDAQVGADGYLKVPQRVPSRASLSRLSFFDAGNSIAAPDTQTFLENIRYFMPSITDLDNTASGVDSDSSKRIEGSSETTRHLQTLPPYNTPREQGNLHEDGSEDVSKGNRTPLTVVSFPNETNTTDEEASLTELDSLPSKSLFSTENEEEGTIFTTPSANSSKVGHDKLEIPPLEGELTNLVEHELQSTGFSIYAEKNNYHLGTVICSSGADSSSRVSHGLLQALAPHDTDSEVVCDSPLESPGLPVGQKSPSRMARRQSVLESMGATIYFVAR